MISQLNELNHKVEQIALGDLAAGPAAKRTDEEAFEIQKRVQQVHEKIAAEQEAIF